MIVLKVADESRKMEEELIRTVGIHKAVSAESAEKLSAGIDRPAAQGQPPEETISQGDCRVEVRSRVSSNVYSEDHGCRPSEVTSIRSQLCDMDTHARCRNRCSIPETNGEPVSVLVIAEIL